MDPIKHAFVVCAYKESPYLETCVKSLMAQTRKTQVIMCTSTPCEYIDNIAEKYGLKLYVRDGESDIQEDWNFACEEVDADWVTVAHQDDIYNKHYAEYILKAIEKSPDSLIAFSDYRPILHGKVSMNLNCRLRRILRFPMKSRVLSNIRFFKKACLAFGNSICCPAVTYHKAIIDGPIFTSPLKFSLDWDTYLKYARQKGRFLYVDKPLAYYRIHNKATTMDFINNETRQLDDIYMFNQFWPEWVTKIIMKIYQNAYSTYKK